MNDTKTKFQGEVCFGQVRITGAMVTPEMAKEWLTKNRGNRNVSPVTVAAYVHDIVGGHWPFTHQGVAFFDDGSLADGQHRLLAIARAGETVPMLVCRGLDRRAAEAMDRHRTRSLGDIARMAHGIQDGKSFAAMCVVLRQLDNKWSSKMTDAINMEIYDANRDGINWALAAEKRKTIPVPTMAAFAFLYPVNMQKVEAAYAVLVSGEGLHRGDPMLTLRDHIATTGKSQNMSGADVRLLLARQSVKALRHYLSGQTFSKMVTTGFDSDGQWAIRARLRCGVGETAE